LLFKTIIEPLKQKLLSNWVAETEDPSIDKKREEAIKILLDKGF